jgi:hypothetical protein
MSFKSSRLTNSAPDMAVPLIFAMPAEILLDIFTSHMTNISRNALVRSCRLAHTLLNPHLYFHALQNPPLHRCHSPNSLDSREHLWVWSIAFGRFGTFRRCIEAGLALETRCVARGLTPLLRAVDAAQPEFVKSLLELGADETQTGPNGVDILRRALFLRHYYEVIEPLFDLLVGGGWVNVNALDATGMAALHDSASSLRSAELLLRR